MFRADKGWGGNAIYKPIFVRENRSRLVNRPVRFLSSQGVARMSLFRPSAYALDGAGWRGSVVAVVIMGASLAFPGQGFAQCPCPGSCPDPEAVGPTDYCSYPDTGCPSPQVNYGTGCCYNPTPIIVDIAGDGFSLTDIEHGVSFPLTSTDEIVLQTAWTQAGSDDAWLALDRNANGKVDNGSELFGNNTPQPAPPDGQKKNGFLALAQYDRPAAGGNGDGWIDAGDSVYSSLRLWQDVNHDGVSQPEELHTLGSLGVSAINLDYKSSRRIDRFGNAFRYRAKVDRTPGGAGRWAFDVLVRAILVN